MVSANLENTSFGSLIQVVIRVDASYGYLTQQHWPRYAQPWQPLECHDYVPPHSSGLRRTLPQAPRDPNDVARERTRGMVGSAPLRQSPYDPQYRHRSHGTWTVECSYQTECCKLVGDPTIFAYQ